MSELRIKFDNFLDKHIVKINIFGLILIIFLSLIKCNQSVNQTENKPQQIHKENVTIQIKDTLQIDNRNFSIIVIDSIEYLCYKSGSKLELIKHKDK